MTDPEFSEEGRTHGSPGSTIFALGLLAFVAVVAVMVGVVG